ncbi:MAG: HEPN domain-containing protein [Thermodesulfobacteriota bacterium]|nr:HEPN domain-containing protein [Thermodesulfobacteriota bacterium]
MINIDKQIKHWRAGAVEDWAVACDLVERGTIRHGLFFAHLALEKTLKGHVCRTNADIAPPIHNLLRLAKKASLSFDLQHRNLLAEVNSFNIEGRYPELFVPLPTQSEADDYLERIGEMLTCLNNLF